MTPWKSLPMPFTATPSEILKALIGLPEEQEVQHRKERHMTIPEFVPFSKIPRLNREVIITEKLDGTNGIIHISEDGVVTAGSRSRWLDDSSAKTDNYGFAKWVKANEEDLKKLGPGYHFGEWWGAGIQRRYNVPEKRFSLFNIKRWGDAAERPACCDVVPQIHVPTYMNTNISSAAEFAIGLLRAQGSIAAPGFMQPEGIVVYHSACGVLFKVTLEGDDKPKSE